MTRTQVLVAAVALVALTGIAFAAAPAPADDPRLTGRQARDRRHVDRAAGPDRPGHAALHRLGAGPGHRHPGGAQGQDRPPRGPRRARRRERRPDEHRRHLPHRVDDEADHLGGADDALRGGQVPPQRPDQQVDAGVRRAQGGRAAARLGRWPPLSAGAGAASDHRAPAPHPHRRVRQLLPRLLQAGGGQGLGEAEAGRHRRRLRLALRRRPAQLPAGRALGVLRRDQPRRPPGRDPVRHDPRRVLPAADLRAAGYEGHPFLPAGGEAAALRGAVHAGREGQEDRARRRAHRREPVRKGARTLSSWEREAWCRPRPTTGASSR